MSEKHFEKALKISKQKIKDKMLAAHMPVEVYKVMWGPIKWSQSMRPRHAIHNRLFQRVGMKSLIVGKSL